uniref:C-type lectin domain-containing protein n=1 Tax=Astyanax mexicanus TaxID=7994 RepID=A0A3B1J3T7_ASTMX
MALFSHFNKSIQWIVFQLMLVTVFPSGVLPMFSSVSRQYHLITDQKSWTDAQTYCREHYADLATVENYMDLGRIQREAQRLSFTSEAWVGLYNDIDSWRCSRNNDPLGIFSYWDSNQPDNLYGLEQCVLIGKDGKWRDGQCSAPIPFICYDVPTPKKRQVMRVVVQSDQDMNDPTVKAALLVKIQQKLKEQGMTENPTLRWKEQSDGSVFYKQKEKRRENMENNTARVCEL